MSAEDTLRASAPLRDRLLSLIGDPTIPPHWRGRAIGLHGEFTRTDPPPKSPPAPVTSSTPPSFTTACGRCTAASNAPSSARATRRKTSPGAPMPSSCSTSGTAEVRSDRPPLSATHPQGVAAAKAAPAMTSTHRQHDPEARRLLAELEDLESAPWPATLDTYAAALLALGQRCEQAPGMAEFHRWSAARLSGLLNGRSPEWREWRADALADVTATIAGTLWAFRAGLDARRRPNLLSMVRAAVIWRANDIAESLNHRHQRRRGVAEVEHATAPADAFTVAFAREVCARLAAGAAPDRALLMIGEGDSIAEAARRTGASRQQVYRARERLVEAL